MKTQNKIFCICLIILGIILLNKNLYNINYEYFTEEILLVDVIGGLGNQLFFIASAYEYSKKFNKKMVILNKKNIQNYGENRDFNSLIYRNFNVEYYDKNKFKILEEKHLKEYKIGNLVLDTNTYFQKYEHFISSRNDFIKKIYFGNNILLHNLLKKYNLISNKKNICIHLRFTDKYTPNNWTGIYSDSEILFIKDHALNNHSQDNILIFTNDKEKCGKYFPGLENIIFVDEKDYEELYIMSKCNIYYCSPSTFNWWGIYLNLNPEKVYLLWKINSKIRNDLYKNYEYLEDKLKIK